MICEDAQTILADAGLDRDSDERHRAEQHAAECKDCAAAAYAIAALQSTATHSVPRASAHAFERALRAATRPASPPSRRGVGFLSGAAVGGLLAAAMVYAVVSLWPAAMPPAPGGIGTPTVELALAEVEDVSIAVYSEQPLADAEIHISLTGEIGIDGFADQRELRWVTQLDRGVNELSLPILALGRSGGQIMVAVSGGGRSRSFLVDVKTRTGADGSAERDGSI